MVMKKLEIPIPDFRRTYRLKLSFATDDNNNKLKITGIDVNGACYTIFKSLKVTGLSPTQLRFPKAPTQKQPYDLDITQEGATSFKILCEF